MSYQYFTNFSFFSFKQFLPLTLHANPKNVLIIGGGDGGVAREVSKFPSVEKVHQVEIDGRVVEISKQYLPHMASGFDSPKLTLTIGDGFEFMKNHQNEFDVIITDSSDPVGPAESLFQESYFELMKNALREGGIVCSQGGTFWTDIGHVKQTLKFCKKQFETVAYASIYVPTYPCGQIGFVIGSKEKNLNMAVPRIVFSDEEIDAMKLKYYTPRTHRAAFDLPRFAELELKDIQ